MQRSRRSGRWSHHCCAHRASRGDLQVVTADSTGGTVHLAHVCRCLLRSSAKLFRSSASFGAPVGDRRPPVRVERVRWIPTQRNSTNRSADVGAGRPSSTKPEERGVLRSFGPSPTLQRLRHAAWHRGRGLALPTIGNGSWHTERDVLANEVCRHRPARTCQAVSSNTCRGPAVAP